MNTAQNYRRAILLLVSTGCLVVAGSGHAQEAKSQGPVRLESNGPLYTLKLLEIADAKPAEDVWILQRGNQETAYKSLSAVSLRRLVAQLPEGAVVYCATAYLPGTGSATRISISKYPSFNDFAAFCRDKGVDFQPGGTSF